MARIGSSAHPISVERSTHNASGESLELTTNTAAVGSFFRRNTEMPSPARAACGKGSVLLIQNEACEQAVDRGEQARDQSRCGEQREQPGGKQPRPPKDIAPLRHEGGQEMAAGQARQRQQVDECEPQAELPRRL